MSVAVAEIGRGTRRPTEIGRGREIRERALWPEESLENERKTGRYVTRLYPFLRVDGAVSTPRGAGTLIQAFSSGCTVQMLRGWTSSSPRKEKHRPLLTFAPEDVKPWRPGDGE